ncbi:DUF1989 domain-containing protein [Cesiribacter andamanensis]|uniref:Urea carboxylase-associated protein 1 n=1 Tax=Cesiribacter andamanensis AMV16 TaxID=1279009 RepID=M7NWJ0_9BACT|nr:urea carboxylase-associated family protein [Cesiribacter andamanensis]EMR02794.1 urea carboxylase-associated protein 1 [Cesiribacter andamanensis AMV16]
MTALAKGRIAPQSGTAFEVKKGQLLKITDPFGEQVCDLMCYRLQDTEEWLSSGRTLDYAGSWLIRQGHVLYSNRSNPMFTILKDTCGRHDFLLTPCSLEMFHKLYHHQGHHPSCHENLYTHLQPWGIGPDRIFTTFNIFMNVQLQPDGKLTVEPPMSKAGDWILLRAEMDLIVGLTACSAGQSNNGRFKPIDWELLEPEQQALRL